MSDAISLQMQSALANTKQPPRIGGAATKEQARRTAEEFEAFALGQFLQPMFENLKSEEPFGGGQAEKMWRSMQVDEYGKAIARAGGIGIADAVYREILKLQEVN
ncbi:MAG TPA: chemotaxis protein [Rhodospirillales bacterium]|nr:chemotaxis protein [Rhodospirillales bacterium]